jgi:hypothetical protein
MRCSILSRQRKTRPRQPNVLFLPLFLGISRVEFDVLSFVGWFLLAGFEVLNVAIFRANDKA